MTTTLTQRPDTVSLFSGIGGLDLGAMLAGLRIGVATDQDEGALALLARALGTPTYARPIEQLEPDALLQHADLRPRDVRYVVAGPPCTAFSHAGFWIAAKREGHDPAANRLVDFLRFVEALEPEAFVLENVPGLLFKTHARFWDAFLAASEKAGFRVSAATLCSADFGVPQRRRRLFVVGIRGDIEFKFPEPTTATGRTCAWAIGDLEGRHDLAEADERVGGTYGELLPLVPRGGNYLHFTRERGYATPLFRYRGRYWSFLLKLDPDAPSPTVPAQRVTYNGPFHWRNRHLRLREIARLQGFPDWYPLDATVARARRHLGNAVPPLLAAHVVWALRVQLGDASQHDEPSSLAAARNAEASVQRVMAAMGGMTGDVRRPRQRRRTKSGSGAGTTARRAVPVAPPPSTPAVRAVMRGNRKRNTEPERLLRSHLHRMGLRFRIHRRPVAQVRCEADAVFPTERVAVFVDGCFWHRCPVHGTVPVTNGGYWRAKIERNVERDRNNDERLATAGWTVIRVWEHERPDEAASRIAAIVRERRSGPAWRDLSRDGDAVQSLRSHS